MKLAIFVNTYSEVFMLYKLQYAIIEYSQIKIIFRKQMHYSLLSNQ